ncbi:MAG: ATP synthase F0 subunit B [Thermodesulfobacteriota bacterium]
MGCDRKWVSAGITVGSGVFLLTGAAQASGGGISVFPDQSCILQIINFLVLIWALNIILYRPMRSIVAKRQEHMSGLDKDIEQAKKELSEKENAYAGAIKEAKTDGMKAKNALLEEGTAEENKIIEEINQKAQQALADNKARIAQDVKKAAADLQKEVEAFAADIGRKILGRELS